MNKKFKRAGATLALLLVGAAGAAGSLAYLQQTTGTVTNTFTATSTLIDNGGTFTLDESTVKWENGNYVIDTTKDRTKTGNPYNKILPGLKNVAKDPRVNLDKVTTECYLFVTVKETDKANTLTWEIDDENWEALKDGENQVTKAGAPVFVKKTTVDEGTNNANIDILKGDKVDFGNFANLPNDTSLEFDAYLVQSAGFDSNLDAWNKTYADVPAEIPGA